MDDDEVMAQVIVRVPAELHERLKARAVEERRTMSEVAREAFRRYLARAAAGESS